VPTLVSSLKLVDTNLAVIVVIMVHVVLVLVVVAAYHESTRQPTQAERSSTYTPAPVEPRFHKAHHDLYAYQEKGTPAVTQVVSVIAR